jgi:hypothetical protein
MVGLRHAIYAAVGDTYDVLGASPAATLAYEHRKDRLTYAVLVALLTLAGRLDRAPKSEAPPRRPPATPTASWCVAEGAPTSCRRPRST